MKRSFLLMTGLAFMLLLAGSEYVTAGPRSGKATVPDADERGWSGPDHQPPHGKALGRLKKLRPRGSSSGIAKADFNGDGFADLAIGVPGEDTPAGVFASGAVIVIYGSDLGLAAPTTPGLIPPAQFWSQNAPGISEFSEAGDRFGSTLAAGDFNGDGYSDLAIGAPLDGVVQGGIGTRGRVVVIYGSPGGLTTDPGAGVPGAQSWSMADLFRAGLGGCTAFGAADESDIGDFDLFGSSLAWGDFNGDGVGDLAVGVPRHCIGGAVVVLYGVQDQGLSIAGGQVWRQDVGGVGGFPDEEDEFGAALAAGDFNGDRRTDLAIGVPGDRGSILSTPAPDVGAVHVLFGGPAGLTSAGTRLLQGPFDVLFVATSVQRSTRFGSVLAAGDFDGDGQAELAVGVPFGDARGQKRSGFVAVFRNVVPSDRLFNIRAFGEFFDQTRLFGSAPDPLVANPTRAGAQFGSALAAGDFNGDGRADLAVGAPFATILVRSGGGLAFLEDAGEVSVIYGSSSGLSAGRPPQAWRESTPGLGNQAQRGAAFGFSLSAWNFGRNEIRIVSPPPNPITEVVATADLAIGSPLKDIGSRLDAGAVQVLYGSFAGNGLTAANSQVWTQASPGVPGGPEASDRFGQAMY